MSTVKGEVQAVTNKWEKFNVLMDDGKWYSTKLDWAPKPAPQKGDTIEFESGATGKYLQKVKILSSGGATESGGKPAKRKYTDNTVGIAVGAAMNQSVTLLSTHDGQVPSMEKIAALAMDLYETAEALKANAAEGNIREDEADRAAAKAALQDLSKEFADE